AVEALVGAVLLGLARIAEHAVDSRVGEPAQDRVRDELRAVVALESMRRTVDGDQLGEHIDNTRRADTPGDVDRERLARVLVDHRQALELLAVRARVEDEVVRPDLIRRRWRDWLRPSGSSTPSRALPRLLEL